MDAKETLVEDRGRALGHIRTIRDALDGLAAKEHIRWTDIGRQRIIIHGLADVVMKIEELDEEVPNV